MEEAQASKDVIYDAIYIRREAEDFFFTLILPDNSLRKLTCEHKSVRN